LKLEGVLFQFNNLLCQSFKKGIIYSIIVKSMRTILDNMVQDGIPVDDLRNEFHVQIIFSGPSTIEHDNLPAEVGEALKALWKDETLQQCFKQRDYILCESAE
jgi:guanine nucleotide-binding protein G(i) subunit alpha